MSAHTGAVDAERLASLRATLVRGCHVLAHQEIVDSSGNVSVRVPGSDRFIVHPRIAPGLATLESLLVLDGDGTVVEGRGAPPLEWPIHARIYRARPDVQAVMHSHSRMSRIFSVSKTPLRPVFALSFNFFEPSGVPVYRGCGLITTSSDGDAVAETLGQGSAALLRGHGNVVVGPGLEQTVVQAVMLEQMAETLHEVLCHGEPDYFSDGEVAQWRARTSFGMQKAWEYLCWKAGE